MSKLISSRVLTPAHHEAIGRVVCEWKYVEYLLEKMIWVTASLDIKTGNCITTHLGSEQQIDILNCLAINRFPNDMYALEVNNIVSELRKLRSIRNTLVHASWFKDKSGQKIKPIAVKIKAKGHFKDIQTPYTARQIKDIAGKITLLIQKMIDLHNDILELHRELGLAKLTDKRPKRHYKGSAS